LHVNRAIVTIEKIDGGFFFVCNLCGVIVVGGSETWAAHLARRRLFMYIIIKKEQNYYGAIISKSENQTKELKHPKEKEKNFKKFLTSLQKFDIL